MEFKRFKNLIIVSLIFILLAISCEYFGNEDLNPPKDPTLKIKVTYRKYNYYPWYKKMDVQGLKIKMIQFENDKIYNERIIDTVYRNNNDSTEYGYFQTYWDYKITHKDYMRDVLDFKVETLSFFKDKNGKIHTLYTKENPQDGFLKVYIEYDNEVIRNINLNNQQFNKSFKLENYKLK